MSEEMKLRVLVWSEDGMFVAQCLDHDICAQAPDISPLQRRMNCLIQDELEENPGLEAAPEGLQALWDAGSSQEDEAANQEHGPEYRLLAA